MYDFVGRYRTWFAGSLLVIVIGLVSLALPGTGLRLGIDFTGGLLAEIRFKGTPSTAQVREVLNARGLGAGMVQKTGSEGHDFLLRTKAVSDQERAALFDEMKKSLGEFEILRVEEVKGVIGKELTRKALLALLVANLGMIAYITIRFEFKFAVTAIIALLHDVLITVGAVSLAGMEVNSPFVAAILTIIGYSINDTIVVYDRIRENLKRRKKEDIATLVNRSISETLMRSINTSLTTLLAVVAILVLGGQTTRDFAFALLVGITAGTYSSIFIASPLWALWKRREEGARMLGVGGK